MGENTDFRKRAQGFWELAKQTPSSAETERRTATRFVTKSWNVQISLPRTLLGLKGGGTIEAKLVELSEGGCRIIAPQEFPKGKEFRLRIEDPELHETVECTGRVAWVTPPPPIATTWILGVEFLELPRECLLRISKWHFHYTSKPH